jgi:hypothetical protein
MAMVPGRAGRWGWAVVGAGVALMVAVALYLVQDPLDTDPDDPGWGDIALFLSPLVAGVAGLVAGVLLSVVAVFRGVAPSWQVALTACVAGTLIAPFIYVVALPTLADAADSAHSALVNGVVVFLGPVLIGAGTVVAIALGLPLLLSALRATRS